MFSSNTYTFLYNENCSIPKSRVKSLLVEKKNRNYTSINYTKSDLKRTKSYSKEINIVTKKNDVDSDDANDGSDDFNNFDISCYQFPPKDYSNIFSS